MASNAWRKMVAMETFCRSTRSIFTSVFMSIGIRRCGSGGFKDALEGVEGVGDGPTVTTIGAETGGAGRVGACGWFEGCSCVTGCGLTGDEVAGVVEGGR